MYLFLKTFYHVLLVKLLHTTQIQKYLLTEMQEQKIIQINMSAIKYDSFEHIHSPECNPVYHIKNNIIQCCKQKAEHGKRHIYFIRKDTGNNSNNHSRDNRNKSPSSLDFFRYHQCHQY